MPARDARSAVERIGEARVYRLRESLLPLVWLDHLLGLGRPTCKDARSFYIAVLESEGLRFGLVVDNLAAPEEIVVKPVSAALREIGVFSGATVLGNGMLALILDVVALARRAGVQPAANRDADSHPAEGFEGGCSQVDHPHTQIASSMVVYVPARPGPESNTRTPRISIPCKRGGPDRTRAPE